MILYNLPSGRVVYITVKRLENLTHADIQDLEASGTGTYCNDPFIKLPTSQEEFENQLKEEEFDSEFEDLTPDMLSDGDDEPFIEIDLDNLFEE
jgi:hypothetical protein